MAKISYEIGNIFNSKAEAIVVTVNCVGFMGKGMALECALRYPEIEQEYKLACKKFDIKIGSIYWAPLNNGPNIALFPTKDDYKHSSKMSYITSGLQSLVEDLRKKNIKSIAMPRLGAELGGLDWKLVETQIKQHFEQIDLNLEIWTFSGTKQDDLITDLISKLSDDFIGVRKSTGVSEVLLTKILIASEATTFASVTDLLKIKGLGKNSVKKLIANSQPLPYVQHDLFGG